MTKLEAQPRSMRRTTIDEPIGRIGWFPWGLAVFASLMLLCVRLPPTTLKAWLLTDWLLTIAATGIVRRSILKWQSNRQSLQRFDSNRTTGWDASTVSSPGWIRWMPLLIVLPQIEKWIQEIGLGWTGDANELVWLTMLQNGAMCMAAIALTSKQCWLAILLSTFLAIFGIASSDRNEVLLLGGIYGIMISWWMMARHWESLERGFIASDSVPLVRLRIFALSFVVLFIAIMAGIAMKNEPVIQALSGFMPTSGGEGRADESARQGVGDGEMLVAAKDQAFTFGPVESELFLESQLPTLYDLATDLFGESVPKNRKIEQAVALTATVQETQQPASESKKNTKEFSTVRQKTGKSQRKKMEGTQGRAVLLLIGRTPLHLRVESFDTFDGNQWTASENGSAQFKDAQPGLEKIAGKPWIKFSTYDPKLVHSDEESIALKLLGYRSHRIVSPSLLSRLHIDQVDRPDFFGWSADGQPIMKDRDHIPQMTILRETYRLPRLHELRFGSHSTRNLTLIDSPSLDPWLRTFLKMPTESVRPEAIQEWKHEATKSVGGIESGTWRGVEAIVDSIRNSGTFDPEYRVPEEETDSVSYFLKNRRGPDYLFASAACMLLRSAGYPARLALGFHASPKNYRASSGQTEVLSEHLHTWVEVYCHGMWLPCEATPGFESPLEHKTWAQWGIEFFWNGLGWVRRHPVPLAMTTVGLLSFLRFRLVVFDLFVTLICWAAGIGGAQRKVRWLLTLFEYRSWIYRRRNPEMQRLPGQTLSKWILVQAKHRRHSLGNAELQLMIESVQRLTYAPKSLSDPWFLSQRQPLAKICNSLSIGQLFWQGSRLRLSTMKRGYSS